MGKYIKIIGLAAIVVIGIVAVYFATSFFISQKIAKIELSYNDKLGAIQVNYSKKEEQLRDRFNYQIECPHDPYIQSKTQDNKIFIIIENACSENQDLMVLSIADNKVLYYKANIDGFYKVANFAFTNIDTASNQLYVYDYKSDGPPHDFWILNTNTYTLTKSDIIDITDVDVISHTSLNSVVVVSNNEMNLLNMANGGKDFILKMNEDESLYVRYGSWYSNIDYDIKIVEQSGKFIVRYAVFTSKDVYPIDDEYSKLLEQYKDDEINEQTFNKAFIEYREIDITKLVNKQKN